MTTPSASPSSTIYVVLIAHPDDESMFFVPIISALVDESGGGEETETWILCLTTGDYDGLGKIRTQELCQAGALLGVSRTICLDTLQDHPTKRWDSSSVSQEITKTMEQHLPHHHCKVVFFTFDEQGVSGHVNHLDTYNGLKHMLENSKSNTLLLRNKNVVEWKAWMLISETNLLRKYLPLRSWWFLLTSTILFLFGKGTRKPGDSSFQQQTQDSWICRLHRPSLNWEAMQTHHSQFVWYRRLFVLFSCYTYVNQFKPLLRLNYVQETEAILPHRKKKE